MLAPISWLKDYVDINVSPEVLAKKLVSIGFEVEEIIYQEKSASKIVVGKIIEVEKHPNADRLRVTQIDIGSGRIQVVTNVPVVGGETIAVALDGAVLADGHKIVKGELRGVVSEGMLCGLEEIGATIDDVEGQNKDDIIRFPEGTALGANALKTLGFDDVILDVGVTANRPDCNSIYKLAKEVAVALKTDCREPEINYSTVGGDVSDFVAVDVQNNELCPRYMAGAVKNVKIFPSSHKIKSRLHAVGIRPINNIVDITNYVLTEIGQPMHAFDLRDLDGGRIVVRNAHAGEEIVTLDGKKNTMTENMLVIADASRPVAIAGVMGGENSGVKDDTTTIIFESAKFLNSSIRRTSRALALRTDSSARFEKGIDFASQEYGIKRALTLIAETNSGEIVDGFIDCKVEYAQVRDIEFTTKQIERIVGCKVLKRTLISILSRLGIECDDNGTSLVAHIREDREDIVGINDIAEEFIRVYGYSHIKPTLFEYSKLTKGGKNAKILFVDRVKDALVSLGLNETISYAFTTPKFAQALQLDEGDKLCEAIPLVNPLGEALSVMRTTLTHSMCETLAFNITHFNKEAALFEISNVYIPKALPLTELPDEEQRLAIGLYGADVDFFTVKGVIEELFEKLSIEGKYQRASLNYLHPGRSAEVYVNGILVGHVGEMHPDSAKFYGVDNRLYVAELSIDRLFELINTTKTFKPFSKFPTMERDLAVVVDEEVAVGDMLDAVSGGKIKYLTDLTAFDTYRSDAIGKDKKSVALSFTFASLEGTLKDDDINGEMNRILSILKRRFGAKIRG
ncbi:MAG: phenylalanine--tRNA ligase subunit beta [Clostridia bacterium]|nr:phenylalanine--tRNA ligase subunit beta [Clostridia bacterium]